MLSQRQFEERAELYAEQGQPHFYFMTLQNDQVIDATRKGNLARFMNHSCNPNCATQKWIVRGRLRIGLFALRRIRAGSELTFDYRFVRFGGEAQRCLCGEPNCKGVIGEEQPVSLAPSVPAQAGRGGKGRAPSTAQEEEDAETARRRFTGLEGVADEEDLTLLARILLRTEEREAVISLLHTLRRTAGNDELMKRFVTLHGLQIVSVLMGLHWRDAEIIGLCIAVLDSLPLADRAIVEDAHVEEKLVRLVSSRDALDGAVRDQAERIMQRWKELGRVFRIPRTRDNGRAGSGGDGPSRPAATASTAPAAGYSLREDAQSLVSTGVSSWSAADRHRGAPDPRRWPSPGDQARDLVRRSPPRASSSARSQGPRTLSSDRRPRSRSPTRRGVSPDRLPPGWCQAHDSRRRPYYYHETTRETRWEPPPLTAAAPSPAGGDEAKKLDAIIERARRAALSRHLPTRGESPASQVPSTVPASAGPPPSLEELEARFQSAVSACVDRYLHRWCRAQLGSDSGRAGELSRKLTHGIVAKEFRHLRERLAEAEVAGHGMGGVPWSEYESGELSAGKRAKVKVFLLQYLKDHGYRIEE